MKNENQFIYLYSDEFDSLFDHRIVDVVRNFLSDNEIIEKIKQVITDSKKDMIEIPFSKFQILIIPEISKAYELEAEKKGVDYLDIVAVIHHFELVSNYRELRFRIPMPEKIVYIGVPPWVFQYEVGCKIVGVYTLASDVEDYVNDFLKKIDRIKSFIRH